MKNVTISDPYEQNAFKNEIIYLKKLDADRFLRGFCDIACIKSDVQKYGGWETSAIQGHTLGHYLSAISQAYASSGDEDFKNIAEHIIEVLSDCQLKNGYLHAIPEEHFDRLENGDTTDTWVPWYSMHKIISGLP